MNSQKQRNWSDIIILLLLPAPMVGIVLILGAVYAIAFGTDFSFKKSNPVEAAIEPTSTISAQAALIATVNAAPIRHSPAAEVALASYDPTLVSRGQSNFLGICAACHGTDAKGISGLGKPLLGSEFVRGQDDPSLLQFVTTGRNIWDPGNTTGVAMPARGGNPGLTDSDILSIIAYIRVTDGFIPDGTTPAVVAVEPTKVPVIVTDEELAFTPFMVVSGDPMGNDTTSTEAVETVTEPENGDRNGATVYDLLCGVSYGGLTPCDYLKDELAKGTSKADLVQVMTNGLSSLDPNNTAGINIPERGGTFPPLTDGEIQNLIDYVEDPTATTESTSTAAVETTSSDRDGAAVYDLLCGVSYGGLTICDYLKDELAKGTSKADLVQVMTNGLSSLDSNNTAGINIPERGGTFPPLTDGEIQNLIDYIEDPTATTESTNTAAVETTSSDRDGAAVYDLLCGVSYGGLTICDYLQDELAKGTSPADLVQVMINGLSSLDPNNTAGINIPERGGTFPPLTDGEIQNLIDYIQTL